MIRFRTDASASRHTIRFFTRLLVAAYLIEAGLILTVAPWMMLWDRNYFAAMLPWLRTLMAGDLLRGVVSLIGIVTVIGGLADLRSALSLLFSRPVADSGDAGQS